ncbi:hypothetical protein RchiOBHm_Chr2g0104501 [Rosa chinensis]|uniref:Uncharacterized protein n=1 Tax=Rosa chinensis TaxID=74649 RepID=A0A2P6RN68_ROSCH|nr:hypothetical protein RchiOBHm_Chr2g0104501 [Rosa chinensis]
MNPFDYVIGSLVLALIGGHLKLCCLNSQARRFLIEFKNQSSFSVISHQNLILFFAVLLCYSIYLICFARDYI